VKAPAGAHLKFRADIEGMRAVAVLLVVLSHAGVSVLAGGYVGVDVFFVISGFLITTLLLGELGRSGTVSLAKFYARRATRLLPASTVVLLATVVASWLWLPATRFKSISLDGVFATFYGINWRLAFEGVQYLNADAEPSPLQHFWSLAVEEQFYLVWPLLLLLGALLWGRRRRKPLVVVLGVVVAVSLFVSVPQTSAAAPWAYFGAHTRAWELAIGALVAVAVNRLAALPRPIATVLTWCGLGAVVLSAFRYDEQTAFPGSAALLPVLGSAAIIAGGCAAPPGGAVRLLGTWPFQQVGKYSYSLYLWHWPLLMIAPHALDIEPSVTVNLFLVAVAVLFAVASYHLVENPVRNRAWLKARAVRGIGLGLALSLAVAGVAQVAAAHPPVLAAGPAAEKTAKVLAAAQDPEAELRRLIAASAADRELPSNVTPKVERARFNEPAFYRAGCHLDIPTVAVDQPCAFGDPYGAPSVFLFGDSHAAHWFPAMDDIAKRNGWKLLVRTKSACQASSSLVFNQILKRAYEECSRWRDGVFEEIRQTRPALVVMASNGNDNGGLVDPDSVRLPGTPDELNQRWAADWHATFQAIAAPHTRMVYIEDTPWPGGDAAECLAEHSGHIARCNPPVDRAITMPGRRGLVAATARADNVTVVDATPWFCTDVCPAVVGNVLVWKDNSHLTTKYAALLSPLLEARLPPIRP